MQTGSRWGERVGATVRRAALVAVASLGTGCASPAFEPYRAIEPEWRNWRSVCETCGAAQRGREAVWPYRPAPRDPPPQVSVTPSALSDSGLLSPEHRHAWHVFEEVTPTSIGCFPSSPWRNALVERLVWDEAARRNVADALAAGSLTRAQVEAALAHDPVPSGSTGGPDYDAVTAHADGQGRR